jgi:isoleucyl-tRNA synthetase
MFPGHEQGAVTFRIKPNFRALGPRLGKGVQAVKKALEVADGSLLYGDLVRTGTIAVEAGGSRIELGRDELEVVVEAAPGFAAETGKSGVVVLHTTLTDELIDEGLVRELLSRVQSLRKELSLGFTERVAITIDATERLLRVARSADLELKSECLATRVRYGERTPSSKDYAIAEETAWISVERV